jgi:hypothetical protein
LERQHIINQINEEFGMNLEIRMPTQEELRAFQAQGIKDISLEQFEVDIRDYAQSQAELQRVVREDIGFENFSVLCLNQADIKEYSDNDIHSNERIARGVRASGIDANRRAEWEGLITAWVWFDSMGRPHFRSPADIINHSIVLVRAFVSNFSHGHISSNIGFPQPTHPPIITVIYTATVSWLSGIWLIVDENYSFMITYDFRF